LSTTPLDPEILREMAPYFWDKFGNPSSVTHRYGWEANAAVQFSKKKIGRSLGLTDESSLSEIIFTGSATEANALAILGSVRMFRSRNPSLKVHCISARTEHLSVVENFEILENEGIEMTWLPVSATGSISLSDVKAAIRPETVLVSLMAANNEIGTLHPLQEISELCKKNGVLFHTDAVQAIGKVSLDLSQTDFSMLTLSAHKIYGPKGIGALWVDGGVALQPLYGGGGQEQGLRSGTVNTASVVGFGLAVEKSVASIKENRELLSSLADNFVDTLRILEDRILINHPKAGLPGLVHLSVLDIDAKILISELRDELALSQGSACSADSGKPSHVLEALGFSEEAKLGALRIGFGIFHTEDDAKRAATIISEKIQKLRRSYDSNN
jgi:cysteine desulfurase